MFQLPLALFSNAPEYTDAVYEGHGAGHLMTTAEIAQ